MGIVRSDSRLGSRHQGRGHDKLRGRAHEAGWPVSSDGSWSSCNSEGLVRPWSRAGWPLVVGEEEQAAALFEITSTRAASHVPNEW